MWTDVAVFCYAFLTSPEASTLDPNIGADYSGTPYPFGMDPVRIIFTVKVSALAAVLVT